MDGENLGQAGRPKSLTLAKKEFPVEQAKEEKLNTRQQAIALREKEPTITGVAIAKLLNVTPARISQILGKPRKKTNDSAI